MKSPACHGVMETARRGGDRGAGGRFRERWDETMAGWMSGGWRGNYGLVIQRPASTFSSRAFSSSDRSATATGPTFSRALRQISKPPSASAANGAP